MFLFYNDNVMSIANKCIDIDNKKKYFIQGLSVAPWNAADGQTHISICGNPWICNEKRLVLKANYRYTQQNCCCW